MILQGRSKLVLQLVVETYIQAATPISSKRLALRHSQLGMSSATLRTIMAELEDAGLLFQPHTSSGRVPTELGMRMYIDSLVNRRLRPWDRTRLNAACTAAAAEFPAQLGQTLAGLSGQMVLLTVPKIPGSQLNQVGLVRCTAGRFLAYFIMSQGFIQQKLIEVDFDVSANELTTIQNFLSDRLIGKSLSEGRRHIQAELRDAASNHDQLLQQALAMANRLLLEPPLDVVVEGTTTLLEQPEFADLVKIRRMLRTIEQRQALLALVERILDNSGVVVMLSSEHALGDFGDLACVGCTLTNATGDKTAVTLIGPSRMDYSRMVPLVRYATELSGRFWGSL